MRRPRWSAGPDAARPAAARRGRSGAPPPSCPDRWATGRGRRPPAVHPVPGAGGAERRPGPPAAGARHIRPDPCGAGGSGPSPGERPRTAVTEEAATEERCAAGRGWRQGEGRPGRHGPLGPFRAATGSRRAARMFRRRREGRGARAPVGAARGHRRPARLRASSALLRPVAGAGPQDPCGPAPMRRVPFGSGRRASGPPSGRPGGSGLDGKRSGRARRDATALLPAEAPGRPPVPGPETGEGRPRVGTALRFRRGAGTTRRPRPRRGGASSCRPGWGGAAPRPGRASSPPARRGAW